MQRNRFTIYAWGVVIVNLAVILWGAYVRASGSGAGCGSHWPACNGQIIPRAAQIETLVEFTHRLTSGLALALVVGLLVWAWRAYPRRHPARLGAALSMLFITSEALVGAGLVLFGLTADDDSTARAVVIVIHLINTFMLLAALTLTAWWGAGGPPVALRGQGPAAWLLAAAWLGVILVGASGAITALGDTLFPASSLREGLAQDLAPTAHFLVRLRVIHPAVAVAVGLYTAAAAAALARLRPGTAAARAAQALVALFLVQLVAGVINLALLAPIWMQIVHLLLADLVWIALVLASASALAAPSPRARTVAAAA